MMNDMRTKSWKKKLAKLKKKKQNMGAAVIREFEEIIKSKKINTVWLACQQGKVFENFKENAKFIEMAEQFEVSKSTITFEINIVKIIVKHPKIKKT